MNSSYKNSLGFSNDIMKINQNYNEVYKKVYLKLFIIFSILFLIIYFFPLT